MLQRILVVAILLLPLPASWLSTDCLAEIIIPVSGDVNSLLSEDWNGDGFDDLVAGHDGLSVFLGT
jgi:hypothetical protein